MSLVRRANLEAIYRNSIKKFVEYTFVYFLCVSQRTNSAQSAQSENSVQSAQAVIAKYQRLCGLRGFLGGASLVAQSVKRLPTMRETRV